ncbi:uncharacterized protein LY89DRAFT_239182 [Mollisia scopiformis]|uniref:Secreted protein n=1 Tax=Mollisia scopiformis TaxID=149040 RepID=A0A194WTA5_MOLSC|nr:uncharacterized protein LY89DRAFT_239182 [Mollisia scopiformis]KUJ11181.1 hypothetical protein LY89DRAFT_239182 [Mollisia scopiformis]
MSDSYSLLRIHKNGYLLLFVFSMALALTSVSEHEETVTVNDVPKSELQFHGLPRRFVGFLVRVCLIFHRHTPEYALIVMLRRQNMLARISLNRKS